MCDRFGHVTFRDHALASGIFSLTFRKPHPGTDVGVTAANGRTTAGMDAIKSLRSAPSVPKTVK